MLKTSNQYDVLDVDLVDNVEIDSENDADVDEVAPA